MGFFGRVLRWFLGVPRLEEVVNRVDPVELADEVPSVGGPILAPEVAVSEDPYFAPEAVKKQAAIGKVPELDTGDFLPISRAELKEGIGGRNPRANNPWFGRQDQIPPASDERTKLIDRAMVTQGLLTPEQLVEIHSVGSEMDRLQPTLQMIELEATLEGAAAVQAR
ncbi:hypothetical protein ACYOEI_32595, partial [Singulisphaera rosea]